MTDPARIIVEVTAEDIALAGTDAVERAVARASGDPDAEFGMTCGYVHGRRVRAVEDMAPFYRRDFPRGDIPRAPFTFTVVEDSDD